MFSGYPTSSVARHGSHIESSFLGNGNIQESGLRNGSSVAVVLQEVDDQREDDSSKSSKRKKKKSRGNGMRSTWMDFRMRRRSAGSSSSSSRRRWWLMLLLLLPVCGCLLVIMEMTMIVSPSHWNSSSCKISSNLSHFPRLKFIVSVPLPPGKEKAAGTHPQIQWMEWFVTKLIGGGLFECCASHG